MDITLPTEFDTLCFEKGKFILKEVSTPKMRLKISKNARWKNIGNDSYETASLGAAAEFGNFADERVQKILRRSFQEHYEIPELPPLPLDLHQWAGLEWILKRKRSYLAHAPGAGKTAQAILASCLSLGTGQSVFIVPPSLVYNWEKEILKVTEWLGLWPAVGIVKGSDEQERVAWKADFILVPDSMLAKDWVQEKLLKMKIKLLSVDEASRFKNPWSERSLAFYGGQLEGKHYSGIFRDARHVVFLDGSPMPNRPIELWAPTYALHPESISCMDYDDFGYRYCGARPNDRGVWEYLYSSNETELQAKLQKDFMHVVVEGQLAHPERLRSMLFMAKDVRSSLQKDWERKHLSEYRLGDDTGQGELATWRKQLGKRKVPFISAYVHERLAEKNESILLFIWHREVGIELAENLRTQNPGLVLGGTPDKVREKYFKEFQSGKRRLLIMNILTGGRGHNLQKADRLIFGEWSWSDEVNKQCEKRTSRRGNEKAFVRSDYIVCPNSMDEVQLSSVFTKEIRVKKVIG